MARILIVDDFRNIRETLKDIFIDAGHTVVGEAANGADGVEQYKLLRPDITTMDIVMPVMHGLEALQHIREFDPDAKVIMLSSSTYSGNISTAYALGAVDFLSKPVDKERVLEAVALIMSAW